MPTATDEMEPPRWPGRRGATPATRTATSATKKVVETFARRLTELFDHARIESGRPVTLTEVARATGLSVSHLSLLRSGKIRSLPSFDRVEALARFFNVSVNYFSRYPQLEVDQEMLRLLSEPLVREIVVRAGSVGIRERALLLGVMELLGSPAQVQHCCQL